MKKGVFTIMLVCCSIIISSCGGSDDGKPDVCECLEQGRGNFTDECKKLIKSMSNKEIDAAEEKCEK